MLAVVNIEFYFSGKSASASSRNLWVSGLASSTRATDLKTLFTKYGKVSVMICLRAILYLLYILSLSTKLFLVAFQVVGAKVVTNAKSPGSRCYGFITMSSAEEASKCIQHLHRTELHGRMISVERVRLLPKSHDNLRRLND